MPARSFSWATVKPSGLFQPSTSPRVGVPGRRRGMGPGGGRALLLAPDAQRRCPGTSFPGLRDRGETSGAWAPADSLSTWRLASFVVCLFPLRGQ